MKRNRVLLIALFLCAFLIVSQASHALLYVDIMSLDVGTAVYYHADTTPYFGLANSSGGPDVTVDIGNLHVFGGGYDYDFINGSITVGPSNQTASGVNGTLPYAIFETGATLTVTANAIKEKSSGTIVLGDGVNDFVLLEAQIVAVPGSPVGDAWYLMEAADDPGKYVSFDLAYQITGGELFDGDEFRMFDFDADWSFVQTGGNPFTEDLTCDTPRLYVSSEVPEPATLMLLLAGGFMIRKKK